MNFKDPRVQESKQSGIGRAVFKVHYSNDRVHEMKHGLPCHCFCHCHAEVLRV